MTATKLISKFWITLLISLGIYHTANSQITCEVVLNDTLSVCQISKFEYTIFNANSDTITISAAINNDTNYCWGAGVVPFFYMADSAANATYIRTDTAQQQIVYYITNDTCTILVDVYLDCSIQSKGFEINLEQSFSSASGDSINVINGSGNTFLTQGIKPPQLQYLGDTTEFCTAFGEIAFITHKYINTGTADANIVFRAIVADTDYCGTGQLLGMDYKSGNGGFTNYVMGSEAFVNVIKGDTLIIREKIVIDSCLQNLCSDALIFSYHCNTWLVDSGIFCNKCASVDTLIYRIKSCDAPVIKITTLHTTTLYNEEYSCFNTGAVQWQYMLTHDSTSFGDIAKLRINLHNGSTDTSYVPSATQLSLMPLSDINLDCRGCTVDSFQTRINNASLCKDSVPDDTDFYFAYIYNFEKTDTLFVSFTTYRCADEADSLLLNQDKNLNDRIMGYEIYKPCDFITVPPVQGVDINAEGPSGLRDISYRYNFIPLINNLQVDTNGVGDSTAVELLMLKSPFIDNVYEYLGVDAGITNIDSMNPKGWLRMKIACIQGLKPAHDSTYIETVISDTSIMTIYPVAFYSNAYDSCKNNESFYYFNMTSDILKALQTGKLKSMIYACCDILPGTQDVSISVHVLPNPDSCLTLTFTDTVTPPNMIPSTQEFIPLVGVSQGYHVHCPGCKAPGIIVDRYSLTRENLGLQDANNNGIADTNAIPIIKGDAYYTAHKAKLQLQNSAFGDKLTEKQIARFNDGYPSLGGYNYQQMLDLDARLDYLNFATYLPTGLSTMKLKVEGFDFYVDNIDSNSTSPCIDCALMEADTVNYYTTLHLSADSSIIHSYLQTDTLQNLFFYTFSTDSAADSNLYSNYNYIANNNFNGYYPNQRYRLRVRYEVCGTFAAPENAGALEDVAHKADITAGSWLAGTQLPLNAPSIYGQMPNDTIELHDTDYTVFTADTPAYLLVDTQFANMFLFYCEWNGGLHYFYAQQAYLDREPGQSTMSCGITLKIVDRPTLAGNYYDPYPYEFHPPAFKQRNIKFAKLDGYMPDSAMAVRQLDILNAGTHTTDTIMLGVIDSIDNWMIENNLPQSHCLTEDSINHTDSTIWFVNELYYNTIYYIHYQPDSCAEWAYIKDTFICSAISTVDSLQCMQLANCENYYLQTVTHKFADSTNTNLTIDIDNSTIALSTGTQCWPIQFENNYQLTTLYNAGPSLIANGAAPFVFIYPMDTSHFTGFYWVHGTDTTWPVNGVLQIARSLYLPFNSSISGLLCANYTNCYPAPGQYATPIMWGYDCYAWPDSNTVLGTCGHYLDTLYAIHNDGDLNATYLDTLHYSRCTPFTQTVSFSTASFACLHVDSVNIDNIPFGFTITQVAAYSVTDTITLSPTNPLSYAIGDTLLAQLGYTGGLLCDTSINILLTYLIACDTVTTNNRIHVTLHTHTACGQYVMEQSGGGYFIYNGINNCTGCFSIDKIASTPIINAFDTITYTIIVTANNGSAQAVVFTELLPPNFNVINNLPLIDTIPAQGSTTYLVTGYFDAAGSCPITNNVVLMTSADTVLSDTACVEVMYPCWEPEIIEIADGTNASSLGVNLFSNTVLYVQGYFNIDIPMQFDTCTIYTAPGALIEINIATLTLNGTSVVACDSMWQGVRLMDEAWIEMNHSVLRDANIGIDGQGSGGWRVVNSTIGECVTGISTKENFCEANNFYCLVAGSRFAMDAPMFRPDYIGQPLHGNIPLAGISLIDMPAASIGKNTMAKNTFHNLNAGIVGCQSDITIYNSTFDAIQIDTAYKHPWHGTAMVSLSGLCGLPGTITVSPNVMDTLVRNSYRGLYGDNTNVQISAIKMGTVDTGIYIGNNNAGQNVNITTNKLNNMLCGVHLYNQAGTSFCNIIANTILSIDSNQSTGIRIGEPSNTPSTNYDVRDNSITLMNGQYGIIADAVNAPQIHYNEVVQRITKIKGQTTEGIVANGCDAALISCNTIRADHAPDQPSIGIRSSVSTNSNITCNTVKLQMQGVYVGGFCDFFNDIKGNTMDSNAVGLYLNGAAVIGTQSHKGNRWLNQDTSIARAINQNIGQSQLSQFIVHTGPGTIYHPKVLPVNGWFIPDSLGSPFSCVNTASCAAMLVEPGQEAELRQVASDSSITTDYIPESKSMAQAQLYDTLARDSALRFSDTLFTNFYAKHELLALGELQQVKRNLLQVCNLDSQYRSTLLLLYAKLQAFSSQVKVCDSLYFASGNMYYINLRLLLIDSISKYQALLVASLSMRHASQIVDAQPYYLINSAITTDAIPQLNTSILYHCLYLQIIYGNDTLKHYTELLNGVAAQCPYSGGPAVYGARNLLQSMLGHKEYNDNEQCLSEGIYKTQHTQQINYTHDFAMLPNPANSYVTVSFNEPVSNNDVLTIYNAYSEVINRIKLQANSTDTPVSTAALSNGIYYIQYMRHGKQASGVKKLVIIK